jgi:hypothetical protein
MALKMALAMAGANGGNPGQFPDFSGSIICDGTVLMYL